MATEKIAEKCWDYTLVSTREWIDCVISVMWWGRGVWIKRSTGIWGSKQSNFGSRVCGNVCKTHSKLPRSICASQYSFMNFIPIAKDAGYGAPANLSEVNKIKTLSKTFLQHHAAYKVYSNDQSGGVTMLAKCVKAYWRCFAGHNGKLSLYSRNSNSALRTSSKC